MEKFSKYSYFKRILLGFLLLPSAHSLNASSFFSSASTSSVSLSFDSLFPISWYQKSLESLLYVWQVLIQAYENDSALPFDAMLSKLALAQYFLNRMMQSGDVVMAEDVGYLGTVVSKIQGLMGAIVVTPQTTDVVGCLKEMVLSIQKQIPCL
jgi:hypothetical protein